MFDLLSTYVENGHGTPLEFGNAICYSGYRDGQSPHARIYPSYEEICQDLQILARNWQYLRLYDCSPHAETVLRVIRNEGFEFNVMLGLDMDGDQVGSGLDETRKVVIRPADHEVDIEEDVIGGMNGLHHGRPE